MNYWIVTDENGRPLTLCLKSYQGAPRTGLLLLGDHPSLLRTRSTARAALARTSKYALRCNLPWNCRRWKVRRAILA